MFEELERMLNGGFNANRYMCVPKSLTLRTDIQNFADRYEVTCDIPGVVKENLKVSMDNNVLTIAVNVESVKDDSGNYLVRERYAGSVSRSWTIQDVDATKITANLENGVLKLILPKMAEKAKKTIEIM